MKEKISEVIINLLKPRTLFAFLFYGTMCYLILKGIEVPDTLNHIVSVLLGWYFGQKVKTLNQKLVDKEEPK